MKKTTKYTIIGLIMLLMRPAGSFAQDETTKDNRPVRSPFDSGLLIDNQTSVVQPVNTLELLIQHRFGNMNTNGISDLFGIYAPGANIRIGFNYTISKNFMIGYGITKKNMYNDFQAKYTILEQTRSNSIPVSVTLYGNMAINGQNSETFGLQAKRLSSRFSYFGQLIIGRKFTDWLSVQVDGSFTHFNLVEKGQDHDKIGVGFAGRAKISTQSSIIFQYDIPLKIQAIAENREFTNPSLPNFAIGYEAFTGTHNFQVYISTADGIVPQDMYMFNYNDFTKGDLMIGFTITRNWNF